MLLWASRVSYSQSFSLRTVEEESLPGVDEQGWLRIFWELESVDFVAGPGFKAFYINDTDRDREIDNKYRDR